MMTHLTSTDGIRPGDVLRYWHDTVTFGAKICYVRVLSVGRKFVTVETEWERGVPRRKAVTFFDRKVGPTEFNPFTNPEATA